MMGYEIFMMDLKKLNRFNRNDKTDANNAHEIAIFNDSIYYIINWNIGMNDEVCNKAENVYYRCKFKDL